MSERKIPNAVIAEVADVLGSHYFSHTALNVLFQRCDAPGDVPLGNCVNKCVEWLRRANEDPGVDSFALLGCVLAEFMEREAGEHNATWKDRRERIKKTLARYGFSYQLGGQILGASTGTPTRSMQTMIRERDMGGLEKEFERALNSVESDPPAAVTAACAIVESLCKIYMQDNGLTTPSDQTIKPLTREVQRHLGLQAGTVEDQDVNRIFGGLASIVDGVGSLRTHAGSAHGKGRNSYKLTGRHARLAIHSAHTITIFILETWDENRRASTSRK